MHSDTCKKFTWRLNPTATTEYADLKSFYVIERRPIYMRNSLMITNGLAWRLMKVSNFGNLSPPATLPTCT